MRGAADEEHRVTRRVVQDGLEGETEMRDHKTVYALIGALIAIGATVAPLHVQAQTSQAAPKADRAAQEAACGGDATQFCGPAIPDEQKIAACLRANRTKISKACQAMLPD